MSQHINYGRKLSKAYRMLSHRFRPNVRFGRHGTYYISSRDSRLPVFFIAQAEELPEDRSQITNCVCEPEACHIGECEHMPERSVQVQDGVLSTKPQSMRRIGSCGAIHESQDDKAKTLCEQPASIEPAPIIRHYRLLEVNSPDTMLRFLKDSPGELLDIVNLRLNFLWVPGHPLKELDGFSGDYNLSELQARRMYRRQVFHSAAEIVQEASAEKVQKVLDTWLEMLLLISTRLIKLRELDVRCYGYEFCTKRELLEALGRLKVSQSVMLHGAYSAAWPEYLEENMKVRVFKARNSRLIPLVSREDTTTCSADLEETE